MNPREYVKSHFLSKALIRNNGIARRLIIAVILFSTAITTLVSGVELYLDYRHDMHDVDERIEIIRKVYLAPLAESASTAEGAQVQDLLNGLLKLGDIEHLSVYTEGKLRWEAGASVSARHKVTVMPLHRMGQGQDAAMGELHVITSVDNVFRRLWSRLLTTLVSNGVKAALVILFILLIFQGMVGQHLEQIAWFVGRMGQGLDKDAPLRLNRPPTGLWRPDALDHVVNTINNMREVIEHTQGNLQAAILRHQAMFDSSPLAIITRDIHGRVTSWNPAAEKIFGWTADEVLGQPLPFVDESSIDEARANNIRVRSGEVLKQIEVVRSRRDGTPVHLSMSLTAPRDHEGRLIGFFSLIADITERKLAQERINFLAFHDALTQLPNRQLLQERFEQARNFAARGNAKIAVLFMDLDDFKRVNDSLGHDVGDALLKEMSQRLRACVRETDTVSRQGGDEFILLLANMNSVDDAAPVLSKLMEQVQHPIEVNGREISSSASIGVAIYPDDGADFETLLKKADMAMYQAKDAGRNVYRYFDETMNREATELLMLRNDLRRAIEQGEFTLHYQPQIDLASQRILGVEALLRWRHPERGLVPPARFIPAAEESGLIVPIGDWVMREACRQAMAWQREGLPELTMAVNLSAVQFRRGNMEKSVMRALEESGLNARLLELEFTESLLINNAEDVLAGIKRLKLLGVQLSIDDFGTGYSSLSYLKRFDIDKLKIDQSFVRDLATDPDDAAIVRAIIQMARSLNLRTVAEGVESEDILHKLRVFLCDEAQGYYCGLPMPADQFVEFLRERKAVLD